MLGVPQTNPGSVICRDVGGRMGMGNVLLGIKHEALGMQDICSLSCHSAHTMCDFTTIKKIFL